MAVIKCRVEVTLYKVIDIDKVTRYYLLQSSTLAPPSKPADGAAISSKWSKTEPSYTSGSTMTLYFVDQTVMSNGAIKYSEVSKSSSYEAAKEAWNKAKNAQDVANSANNKIDLAEKTGTGGNLIKNGYGELLDNTNFTNGTFTRGDCPDGCYGYFTNGTTDLIPFNPNLTYELEYYARLHKGSSGNNCFSIQPIDVDGLLISSTHVLNYNPNLFYLNQDLNDGDTVVHFKSLAEWYTNTSQTYQRSFLIFGYKDKTGYTYPDGTYSRKYYEYVYSDNSSVNKINNTITLRSAWNNGTVKAGTCIGQASDGSTYCYYGQQGVITNSEWKKYTAIVVANNDSQCARRLLYAKSIRIHLYNSVADYAKLFLGERKITNTYTEYYLSTSQTSLAGGSWSTTAPTWVNGKYMWSRTVTVDGVGDKTYSPSQNGVCIAGAKGDTGAKGEKGDTGATGKGIKSTTITYQLSASRTTAPTGTWVGSPPDTDIAKPYLWTRTIITYTDNTTSSPAYSVSSTLDSLVVGGRNLILDSDVWDTSGSTSTGITASRSDGVLKVVTTSGNGNWQSFSRSNVIEANLNTGDTFTFGIEIKSADGTKPPTIYFKNGMGYYSLKGTVSSDYSWCYYTGTWNKTNDISFHFGWSSAIGTYYIRKIKLEKGNILTDWTPAPEDIKTRIDDAYTEIESNKTEISLKASQSEVTTISSNLNAYIDSSTTMIQNVNGWQFNFNKLIRTDEADVANHTDYITLQNGDIILGESGSDLKLKIGNDAIQFKGNIDEEVTPDPDATAWITGQKFNINEGEIHTTLKVGSLQFTPRPNGNFSLTIV